MAATPPAYPVSAPCDPTTRWQGTTMHRGLAPSAAPTAREAVGRSMALASPPYVSRSPYPTVRARVSRTTALERRRERQVGLEVEVVPASGQEVVELVTRVVQGGRHPEHSR